jgi:hypothetical protein
MNDVKEASKTANNINIKTNDNNNNDNEDDNGAVEGGVAAS